MSRVTDDSVDGNNRRVLLGLSDFQRWRFVKALMQSMDAVEADYLSGRITTPPETSQFYALVAARFTEAAHELSTF